MILPQSQFQCWRKQYFNTLDLHLQPNWYGMLTKNCRCLTPLRQGLWQSGSTSWLSRKKDSSTRELRICSKYARAPWSLNHELGWSGYSNTLSLLRIVKHALRTKSQCARPVDIGSLVQVAGGWKDLTSTLHMFCISCTWFSIYELHQTVQPLENILSIRR